MTKLMEGKKGVIMGVANERSIAWGIARALSEAGAEIAFTYQGEVLEKRVRPLAASIGSDIMIPADATDTAGMDRAFAMLKERFGSIDFLVHSIAYAGKDALKGRFVDVSREDFATALNISCFSFVDAARRAAALMDKGGSILTMSYYGAEKVLPNYNVMGVAKAALEASVRYAANDLGAAGVRVNAISAGPIKTLAAAGIGEFSRILEWNALNAPLRRNVSQTDVGQAGLFLLSDMAGAITGEVMHVDAGYNTVGMLAAANARKSAAMLADFPEVEG
ncbi:enoyl-[acyl-carrier-protein] reductase [NADH] [Alphaproteobacteria bacterium]|nr:enoyl-[acyl-carrier-protein] reductase [NADH] [Alphaproteobacteria bacterium]